MVRYGAWLLFSGVGGLVPATLFALALRVAPGEHLLSTTLGWVQQWSALGQFSGPPAMAFVAVQAAGWQFTWVATGACSLLGLGLAMVLTKPAAPPPQRGLNGRWRGRGACRAGAALRAAAAASHGGRMRAAAPSSRHHNTRQMQTVAVIDFETTGMSPALGARATEIAAVLVRDGEVVGRFQSLMNSGAWVPPFIEQLTGISNAMLARAPAARAVMHELMHFTRGCPLVAHNAAFDRGFWHAEVLLAQCEPDPTHQFACTLLLARRLYPQAPNHKLGTLAALHSLPDNGRAHRALADALTTAQLWLRMQHDVRERFAANLSGRPLSHELLCTLQRVPRTQLERCFMLPARRTAA